MKTLPNNLNCKKNLISKIKLQKIFISTFGACKIITIHLFNFVDFVYWHGFGLHLHLKAFLKINQALLI